MDELYDEEEAASSSDRADHSDKMIHKEVRGSMQMVIVVTYCSSPPSVMEKTHLSQQSSQRSSSPLEDMDENAPIGLRSRRPNQASRSSSLTDLGPPTKTIRKRKIIEESDFEDDEEQENIPPKKLSKKEQEKVANRTNQRRSTRLRK
ncbi:hypothetical protein M422DRAFT_56400 [Sphaerobolus stellatus SS14]|uniref:Uncharacterized protein n=1 Tax=Sphaerobolus stellatus (strain SS14) TaxID=990650 RepID=A0A0C9TRG6_SPHS4|nr:hypothetical protein M422DRAFT_56400 [Sphaerobolus stellatus SS14]